MCCKGLNNLIEFEKNMQKHCKVKKKQKKKHKPSKHMQQKYAAYPVNTTKLLCEQKQNRAFPQIFKSESIIRYVLNTNTAIHQLLAHIIRWHFLLSSSWLPLLLTFSRVSLSFRSAFTPHWPVWCEILSVSVLLHTGDRLIWKDHHHLWLSNKDGKGAQTCWDLSALTDPLDAVSA